MGESPLVKAKKPCPTCQKPPDPNRRVRTNRTSYCDDCYYTRYGRKKCPGGSGGHMRSGTKAGVCRSCLDKRIPPPREMSEPEVAWLAGIVEGEGTFVAGARYGIVVSMTDQDVIDRLAGMTGVGQVYHNLRTAKAHHKPPSSWCVRRVEHIEHVIRLIDPWLGERRKVAAQKLLDRIGRSAPSAGVEPATSRLTAACSAS